MQEHYDLLLKTSRSCKVCECGVSYFAPQYVYSVHEIFRCISAHRKSGEAAGSESYADPLPCRNISEISSRSRTCALSQKKNLIMVGAVRQGLGSHVSGFKPPPGSHATIEHILRAEP